MIAKADLACQIMGVLNVTPDSFSDGGSYIAPQQALERAVQMVNQGADIIDVGGESTRPGSQPVTEQEELARVLPVIQLIKAKLDTKISIDTVRPAVMRAAVDAGADMINDVCALTQPGALHAVVDLDVPVCLMHMQKTPSTMQCQPVYDDVVSEVKHYLSARVEACLDAGIKRELLTVDPGFGFGKSLSHNLQMLNGLGRFAELGLPLLVGLSRKSMIGQMIEADVGDRLNGSVVLAVLAAQNGANIIRVHDVRETRQALMILDQVIKAKGNEL